MSRATAAFDGADLMDSLQLGIWLVKGFPARLDRSPAYAGGILGRSGSNYGEDTQRVLSSVLGMTEEHVPSCARLASCDGCVEIAGAPRCSWGGCSTSGHLWAGKRS
jgi:hypothetical protein